MFLAYFTHLIWFINNPFLGHSFQTVSEPESNLFFILVYVLIFSFAYLFFRKDEQDDYVSASSAMINSGGGYGLFILITLLMLSKVGVHAGLRTHTLIFCSAVGTPPISINAYPKSAGFIRTVGMGDWTIDFENLSVENLSTIMRKCWEDRHSLAEKMKPVVEIEKKKSRDSVDLVTQILDTL